MGVSGMSPLLSLSLSLCCKLTQDSVVLDNIPSINELPFIKAAVGTTHEM